MIFLQHFILTSCILTIKELGDEQINWRWHFMSYNFSFDFQKGRKLFWRFIYFWWIYPPPHPWWFRCFSSLFSLVIWQSQKLKPAFLWRLKKKKLSQAPFEFQSLASEFIIDFRISSVAAYGIPVMPVSQDTPSLPNHPKFLQPVCCLGTEL